uniref:ribonuclease H n=1 Tax=Pseudonaja textilis TaxID=8673 RepID=A0A670Z133_PSETE
MVRLNVGGKPVTFLVDTGATRSVLTQPLAQASRETINIQGATGTTLQRPFLEPLECTLKGQAITHQFVYMPDCPVPLLGRDLLCKMRAQLSFNEDGSMNLGYGKVTLSVPLEESWRLMVAREFGCADKEVWRQFKVPYLWAEDNPPGFAAHHPPILIEEVPLKVPVRIRQRAYPRHIMQAIQDIIDLYLEHHILVPTESPWNTPILPIPKGDGRFRPVQDLRPVNLATITIHPVVPNPYVILGLIPREAQWFSVIDLKDAFFTIPIHKKSQHLFAFEWENPNTGRKQQYTWTRLPQEFKNSPTLFGAALARDLEALHIPAPDVVLQYVDDLLVTGYTEDACWQNTADLLSLLQDLGYKASRKKAQLLTFGQQLHIYTPHALKSVLEMKGHL